MNKFKCGDKVRLKADANFWGENHLELKKRVLTVSKQLLDGDSTVTILECVEAYPNDFELVEPAPEKHIHYDMIVEWAANPSRVVEYYDAEDTSEWRECRDSGIGIPVWDISVKYRFKLEESERVFPTTSLTDDELVTAYCQEHIYGQYRNIANEAIKRYILEQEVSK